MLFDRSPLKNTNARITARKNKRAFVILFAQNTMVLAVEREGGKTDALDFFQKGMTMCIARWVKMY